MTKDMAERLAVYGFSSREEVLREFVEVPEDEAMRLLSSGIEALKPFGPPSPAQLRLMYAHIPNCEDHAHASIKIHEKLSFKRIYGLLYFWWASLRKVI